MDCCLLSHASRLSSGFGDRKSLFPFTSHFFPLSSPIPSKTYCSLLSTLRSLPRSDSFDPLRHPSLCRTHYFMGMVYAEANTRGAHPRVSRCSHDSSLGGSQFSFAS